jgi:hypothetical protein
MNPSKQLRAVRKRLLTEFSFYSKASLKIRTKAGDIKPLKLNAAQTILDKANDILYILIQHDYHVASAQFSGIFCFYQRHCQREPP